MVLHRVAGFLLSVALLAGASSPVAARLGAPEAPRTRSCRCVVVMDCCLSGQCTMGERPGALPDGPALGPCRGARPDPFTQAPPDLLALLPGPAAESAPGRSPAPSAIRPLAPTALELPVDPLPPRLPS